MANTKVYIGDELDLEVLNGDDIIGFTFTVTNEDTTAYDFTGYTDINLIVYQGSSKKTTLATIPTADLAIASNVITWTTDYSATINLDNGVYYYTLTYNDASSRPVSVCYGNFEVV